MPRIDVLLVRHGKRAQGADEATAELTVEGAEEAMAAGNRLAAIGLEPTHCLTAKTGPARRTTQVLLDRLALDRELKPGESIVLTPHGTPFGVEQLLAEAGIAGADTSGADVVLLVVGHEGRLSQLISAMTRSRFRPLERAEAVCVSADCLSELLCGRARLEWRTPVRAYQEAELRDKLGSKMTVTAIFTGFNAAALVELTTDRKLEGISGLGLPFADSASALHWLAILLLIAASALFLAAAYIYDRLSMPEGFWIAPKSAKSRWDLLPPAIKRDMRDGFGVIYAHMVYTWNWFFTPAVVLSAAGLLCLVAKKTSVEFAGLCAATVLLVGGYYWWLKPRLGVD